ncbi:MAG: UDP-N-acetylmuramoyl-tripeptide--D-alanyl-D-alanine ligase [Gracilibacteraceae bacterium]|jgi:UDP-N-acetylmuramoyl-tripeptide--D-alanyl-D-alanine ligase|nr:UDP-N-acetylmuramoyl-tripeptide--D-alanyl-D-alanine ligase [Gracilibacteraceae bacterium]
MTAGEAARLTGGALRGEAAALFSGCAIDSRALAPGMLFVALPGARADGRRFIGAAFAAGAGAALSGPALETAVPPGKAIIVTEDPLAAMQNLARFRRDALGARVVAVTGSNGKTTTKDLTAAVLSGRFRVYKSEGNHNNEIGLPLTVLNAPDDAEALVLEMGMRGLGQISALCRICRPDTAVLTNIGSAHMELLGSRENIARAKWELVESLPPDGPAVLNAEDEWSAVLGGRRPGPKIYYGTAGRHAFPEVRGLNLRPAPGMFLGVCFRAEAAAGGGKTQAAEVRLPLAGEHNVLDALAALATGLRFGVPLAAGAAALETARLSSGRLEVFAGRDGTIIDDSYNANPDSMLASLAVLAERGGARTVAVLGGMLELGAAAEEEHRRVGAAAAALGIGHLVGTGELGAHISAGALAAGMPPAAVTSCRDNEEALAVTQAVLREKLPAAWVLVKGSRGARMEEISRALRQG